MNETGDDDDFAEQSEEEAVEEAKEEEEAMPDVDLSSMSDAQRRLFHLKMKLNQGRKLNRMAVKEEHQRKNTPNYEAKLRAEERKESNERWAKELQARGLTTEEGYLFETAEQAQRKQENAKKKEKNKAAFGWDVFNQDSLFKGYKKRLSKLPQVCIDSYVGRMEGRADGSVCVLSSMIGVGILMMLTCSSHPISLSLQAEGGDSAPAEDPDPMQYGQASKGDAAGLDRLVNELDERVKCKYAFFLLSVCFPVCLSVCLVVCVRHRYCYSCLHTSKTHQECVYYSCRCLSCLGQQLTLFAL